jgi:hypothetical protein
MRHIFILAIKPNLPVFGYIRFQSFSSYSFIGHPRLRLLFVYSPSVTLSGMQNIFPLGGIKMQYGQQLQL